MRSHVTQYVGPSDVRDEPRGCGNAQSIHREGVHNNETDDSILMPLMTITWIDPITIHKRFFTDVTLTTTSSIYEISFD